MGTFTTSVIYEQPILLTGAAPTTPANSVTLNDNTTVVTLNDGTTVVTLN